VSHVEETLQSGVSTNAEGITVYDQYCFSLLVGSLILYHLTHRLLLMGNWDRSRRCPV